MSKLPDIEAVIREKRGELSVAIPVPIQAEDGRTYLIDQLYHEAIKTALDGLTTPDNRPPLTLRANRSRKSDHAGQPQLIPTGRAERPKGLSYVFPLSRIIHDARAGQRIVRRNSKGKLAFDWTVQNTKVVKTGREDTRYAERPTRIDFLNYLEAKGGHDFRLRVSDLLRIADALLRRDEKTTTVETPFSPTSTQGA